ncbi:MAG TPA: hypothetical protein VFS10_15195 [Pyrinomonadaceae bacterium]|nr:hypothetical protein [Pyrinomonadaceae bacterium]
MSLTRIVQLLFLLTLLGGAAHAQRPRPTPTPDPYDEYLTKMELLLEKTGAVVVKGSTTVGTINGLRGTATFTSWEMLDTQTGSAEYGVSILIGDTGRSDGAQEVAYVDYDELDGLIKGIDHIIKLENSSTKLARFEAQYKTRGGLAIFRFNAPGGYGTAISTEGVRGPRLILRPTGLVEFRDMVESAKTIIDDARK